MATAPTIYQKRQATRRSTADIERLGKQFQTGLLDVTQQQQNAFTEWQKNASATMAPYEASVQQYTNVSFPAYQQQLAQYNQAISTYEQQAAAYRERLNAFQASLKTFEASLQPEPVVQPQTGGGLIAQVRAAVEQSERASQASQRAIPTFTEQAPTAPAISMPTPPAPPGAPPPIASLDVAPFAAKRGELETTFKRELGERKAAKQNVVMRRIGRPMLQET